MKLFKITDPFHFPTDDQFFLVMADNQAHALAQLRQSGLLLSAQGRILEMNHPEVWAVDESL